MLDICNDLQKMSLFSCRKTTFYLPTLQKVFVFGTKVCTLAIILSNYQVLRGKTVIGLAICFQHRRVTSTIQTCLHK